MGDRGFTRRQFLRTLALGAGIGMLAPLLQACARAVPPSAAPTLSPTLPAASPTPASALPGVGASQGAPPPPTPQAGQVAVTRNADFYTVAFRGEKPALPADWRLVIDGSVERSLTLTLDDLKAMPAVEEMRTLACISNPPGGPLISNAVWKGLRMKDLLAQVGIKPGAVALKLESFDGYSTAIPLELAQHDHSLLVYEMNGEPLPIEHGKPLRCLWPGRYGMKQPKWLTHISAIAEPYQGFWEKQGWTDEALIRPLSRIDLPEDNSTVTATALDMAGIGFSGESGIAGIQVSVDDGKTWQPADLVRGPTPYVWTQWSWHGAAPTEGEHLMYARVTDSRGVTQVRQSGKLLGSTFPLGTLEMQPIVVEVKKG